ncbi:hypothetical protein ACOI9X_25290 [Pseudomonas sp. P2757]|uniref:hypothetical protein n=1 Tax=unclassified Pseudomonas TaxID=196821 RepID=UPI003B5BD1DF
MTVIAIFDDYQLAISDMLLSVENPAVTTTTPTTGNTALIADLQLGVSRLVRKVVAADGPIGRAELLVAGTVTHIEHFSSELNKAFRNPQHLPEELLEIVREKGPLGCLEVAALITNATGLNDFEVLGVAGNKMCSHTFDANKIATNIPYFGTVRIAGGGASDLLSWLELRAEAYAARFANSSFDERRFHIGNNIPLFLMEEDLSHKRRTIKNGVGGFYEAYEILSGQLIPIGDWLTIFADIIGKARDQTVLVRRLMYHCYSDDYLYVLSLKHDALVSATSPTSVPLSECALFEIPPLNAKPNRSKWTIHRVATQLAGASKIRSVIRKNDSKTVTRRFISSHPDFSKLLKIGISGANLNIELDLEGFQHFASRFSDDKTSPILV